jgi:hypothetical protein
MKIQAFETLNVFYGHNALGYIYIYTEIDLLKLRFAYLRMYSEEKLTLYICGCCYFV